MLAKARSHWYICLICNVWKTQAFSFTSGYTNLWNINTFTYCNTGRINYTPSISAFKHRFPPLAIQWHHFFLDFFFGGQACKTNIASFPVCLIGSLARRAGPEFGPCHDLTTNIHKNKQHRKRKRERERKKETDRRGS